ncbi:MAG: carotenoid biosynthesis protein [Gemmatimonadaceae bacterium]|nr:carotenoid biosynthesis protein [Gemmatimonadaceae bacterium]
MTSAPPPPPGMSASQRTLLLRIAGLALLAHVIAHVLSSIAFATFLAPPMPAWLAEPFNAKVYAFGMHWGGQGTVVLGAIAGFCFCAAMIGMRPTLIVGALAFFLSLGAELAGTFTGLPFGVYYYTQALGYKILDLVPYNIPTSWFYMLVACMGMCGRLLPGTDDSTSRWWWAFVCGLLLTAWDVVMDPAMVKTAHWLWNVPDLSGESAFVRFIGEPIFYGMPITNWLGWLLTGTLVARAMLVVVPPSTWARQLSHSDIPLVLYAVNGLLAFAICFRQGMVPAGLLGLVTMGLPLWLSWRAGRRPAPIPARARLGTAPIATAGD